MRIGGKIHTQTAHDATGTNLYCMLRIPSVKMRKNLLEFMITTYDSTRKRFIIRPNTDGITVLNEDVYDIFGLRNEDDDVSSMIATVQLDAKKLFRIGF